MNSLHEWVGVPLRCRACKHEVVLEEVNDDTAILSGSYHRAGHGCNAYARLSFDVRLQDRWPESVEHVATYYEPISA